MLTLKECERVLKLDKTRGCHLETIARLRDSEEVSLDFGDYRFDASDTRRAKTRDALKAVLLAYYTEELADIERELSQLVVKP